MSDTILAGDFTVFYAADNGQKRIEWTGSATGTRTLNELYSALQSLFDDPSQMDDLVPMSADTPDIYRMINQWFIDDTTVEHLTGGALFSADWVDGTDEHVLVIGYALTTEFDAADIGRTIRGATTGDTGTLLDFNTTRNLVWIRPDDPAVTTGDEFDNGTESYTIGANANGDDVASVKQDDGGVFTDDTTDANSAADGDVELFPAVSAVADAGYIGFAAQFSKVIVDRLLATQGVAGVTAYEYSQGGDTWAALAGVSDATATGGGFGNAVLADGDAITFTVPSDWATDSIDGSAQLYWIRFRVTTVYTTEPIVSQIFVSGVGAGAFASHTRHGSASTPGEAAWAGVTTIGTIETNSHLYVFGEDPDQAAQSFNEVKVIATKGTSDWWSDGQIDVLLKVKEADSVFGELPGSSPATAVATVLARQYSKSGSHFIATALNTAGGNTVVPLATADDADNTTGPRQSTAQAATGAGTFVVDEVLSVGGTPRAIVTLVAGTTADPILDYYLINDPLTDLANGDAVTGDTSGATMTSGVPIDVGPGAGDDANITVTFGDTADDIGNGNGSQPYSVIIDQVVTTLRMTDVYERMKFIVRRGSVISLQGQDGEEYLGAELAIEYTVVSGTIVEGNRIVGATSGAEGIVVANDTTDTRLIVKEVRGTFQDAETINEGGNSATIDGGGRRTITPTAAAAFGTFAGGTFFGAPGVRFNRTNLNSGDLQAYQLIDDLGVTQIPPNTVSMTVDNLVSGDTVSVYRRTGADVDKTQLTLAAGNNQGDTTVVVDASIPSSNPTDANSKIRIISSSGVEHRYRYDSFAGSTFTLAPLTTGTADGGSSNTILIDAASDFVTDEVEVGDYVRNETDDFVVRVVSVDSATQLTTENGGATWNAKVFRINALVENYGLDSAYVPYIERIADATSESNTLIHTSDIDIKVDVRNAGVILPFTVDTNIVSTGRTTSAIRTADTIFV